MGLHRKQGTGGEEKLSNTACMGVDQKFGTQNEVKGRRRRQLRQPERRSRGHADPHYRPPGAIWRGWCGVRACWSQATETSSESAILPRFLLVDQNAGNHVCSLRARCWRSKAAEAEPNHRPQAVVGEILSTFALGCSAGSHCSFNGS